MLTSPYITMYLYQAFVLYEQHIKPFTSPALLKSCIISLHVLQTLKNRTFLNFFLFSLYKV